jgi:hypothetical protein
MQNPQLSRLMRRSVVNSCDVDLPLLDVGFSLNSIWCASAGSLSRMAAKALGLPTLLDRIAK